MSECKNICKLCNRLIISRSVTVVTVNGVDTLVIDLPLRAYNNCEKYCIIVAQAIPTTATILMPVAFSINGVTTTVYPLTRCDCTQVTACGIRTRTKYSTRVIISGNTGVFRLLGNVCCYPQTNASSLPVPTAPAPATPAVASAEITSEDNAAMNRAKNVSKTVTTKTVLKAE